MTTFNSMQTEPAFISHQKATSSRAGLHKRLTDCFYSLSNLALIFACIVALIFSAKFIYDETLYEYGEHLLSLRFYRQLIYIIVILPLAIIVPLFNTASAFFVSSKRNKQELGKPLLTVKLTYELILALLIFVGLIFIAPSIRFSLVANQIGYELRKHMKRRYENNFSYEFLDTIQEEYECCDELWYRANYSEKLPLSCFLPDGFFATIYEQSCADVLGALVSNRCIIIAVALVVMLVALAALIGIDVLELIALSSGRHYDVGSREANLESLQPSPSSAEQQRQANGHFASSRNRRLGEDGADEDDDGADLLDKDIGNRLRLNERERAEEKESSPAQSQSPAPILTRANYLYKQRPQSPRLVAAGSGAMLTGSSLSLAAGPSRGVLKKSPSSQRMHQASEDGSDDDDDENLNDYQRQLQRELQTRRSLLSVRFAE